MNPFLLAMHSRMLSDEARLESLNAAIQRVVRPGDIVVDVGTGSGILSVLAARAGAERVFALEATSLATIARRVIADNCVADKVDVVQTPSQDWCPPTRVDVVMCETLGIAAFEEGFRSTIVDARERMLRSEGHLIPRRIRLSATPIDAETSPTELERIRKMLGVDLRALMPVLALGWHRDHVPETRHVAAPRVVFDQDTHSMTKSASTRTEVSFSVLRSARIHALALWFEAELADGVVLSSATPESSNHWGQAILPLETPVAVEGGDVCQLTIKFEDDERGFRIGWELAATRPPESTTSQQVIQ